MDNLLPHQNLSLDDMDGEIWKDIKDYEGIYQTSSFGRVKSLKRYVSNGKGGQILINKKILKICKNSYGYPVVGLTFNSVTKLRTVHQLVAESFLNHQRCGLELVVNHIDFNRTNNNLNNLEIVTVRQNTNKKHIKSSSQYTGVIWHKVSNKWRAEIWNKKTIHIGLFANEFEAYQARCDYEKANNI